ncbi:MAG TPA: sigma-54 dependent transcriptional regulator [bacterium]|nr:sigma-54 dependent transcriptional regulator [bacterium]
MNILIIDENEIVRRHLFWALRKGHALHEAVSREEAQNILQRLAPDVILMELLEERDADESAAVAMVERLLAEPAPPSIIIITRSDRKEVAAHLLEMGVADVFTKPFDPEELQVVLKRVERLRELRPLLGRHEAGSDGARPRPPPLDHAQRVELGIVGVDRRIKQILEQIRRIAPTPVSVLIMGETGTGKEIFAQAVHTLSDRRQQRMVPLNCAVLSDTLVEDELFGHEKGAFTGAVERRKGKFEYANKGSLFLDEIGEMSPRLQAKFLRVVQERTFERLGGNTPIETDFRLISATHRDLPEMVQEGTFREDLMFRVNVVSFHIPPLRDRRGDVKLLGEHFLTEFAKVFGRTEPMRFSREVIHFMYDYPWPGNVRELRHFVERAVALADGRTIGTEALPESFTPTVTGEPLASDKGHYDKLVKKYKRQLVMEALQSTGNNKVQTAQLLGISKSYLFKLIKQLSVPA